MQGLSCLVLVEETNQRLSVKWQRECLNHRPESAEVRGSLSIRK